MRAEKDNFLRNFKLMTEIGFVKAEGRDGRLNLQYIGDLYEMRLQIVCIKSPFVAAR